MSVFGVQMETPSLRERLNNANLTSKQMQSMGGDIIDLKTQIEKLNDKISRLSDSLNSKCCKDDLIDVKSNHSALKQKTEELETVMTSFVDKNSFKTALDDVSCCFEEYVLNAGNTPRINVDGFERRMAMLEEKIAILASTIEKQPKVNIRTASDIDPVTVPSLDIQKSDSLFRKPIKQEKPK